MFTPRLPSVQWEPLAPPDLPACALWGWFFPGHAPGSVTVSVSEGHVCPIRHLSDGTESDLGSRLARLMRSPHGLLAEQCLIRNAVRILCWINRSRPCRGWTSKFSSRYITARSSEQWGRRLNQPRQLLSPPSQRLRKPRLRILRAQTPQTRRRLRRSRTRWRSRGSTTFWQPRSR